MNALDRMEIRAAMLSDLLDAGGAPALLNDPNRPLLASMIAGQAAGQGCLPAHLGLGPARFSELLARLFPGTPVFLVRREIEEIPELDDLRKLLLDHRAHPGVSAEWMADIVATACAGRDHLWQDLGLANRDELSRLMRLNFKPLADQNVGDMKWKKFLYKQFCAAEGIYVCPAPSCGECADHPKCFGPET
ncbi:MAG: nitrogen fixation protein NifQ [Rhodocyclaceae bacterium]